LKFDGSCFVKAFLLAFTFDLVVVCLAFCLGTIVMFITELKRMFTSLHMLLWRASESCTMLYLKFFQLIVVIAKHQVCFDSYVIVIYCSCLKALDYLPLARNSASRCQTSQRYDRPWASKTPVDRLGACWVLPSWQGI